MIPHHTETIYDKSVPGRTGVNLPALDVPANAIPQRPAA